MSNAQPFVSVLMTAYNREKYIAQAIQSVLDSTYIHFELLVVDDGSSDNTVAIARQFAQMDKRITVYINEKNLGDYHNRNQAASYAKGKYIKYVDSDDLIYPESLGIFVRSMEAFPDAAVGIMSRLSQDPKPYPYQMQPAESYQYHFYVEGLFDTGPSALIFHTGRFREAGGFSGKRYVGDTEINLKLAARWPLVKIASSLVYWRQHEGQEIVAGNISTGYLELQLPMFTEALDSRDCPLEKEQKNALLDYFRRMSALGVLKLALQQRRLADAKRVFGKLQLSAADVFRAVLFRKKHY